MYSIAFIEPHLLCVGGIRRIIEVSNRLQKLGNSVAIFTPDAKPCRWIKNDVPVRSLKQLTEHSYDIVLFNLAEQYHLALNTKAKVKVFWVLAAEALYKNPVIPTQAVRQKFTFMANSTFTANYIIKSRAGLKTNKIYVINGGINPEHFHYDKSIKKDIHVLYYGSPRPWKGTAIIESAIQGAKVTYLKMHGRNTPQDQMYKLYNRSKMFISATQIEGFNFMPLEAMACGCPVICTADGGNADFVKPGINALVVRREPTDIRRTLIRLLQDEPLQQKLIAAGLKTASEPRFNWDNIAGNVNKLFNTLIK